MASSIEVEFEHRRPPLRRPSPRPVGPFAQSAFIDEDDGLAPLFNSGQRRRFHFRMADSFRSKALPAGRCRVQARSRRDASVHRGTLHAALVLD